jgi:hypothetical protein
MRIVSIFASGLLTAVLLAAADAASAQGIDPTARYDIDDVLHRHPHDISNLPTQESSGGRPITFNFSLAGTYTTNAGATNTNAIDTAYVTPSLGLSVTPVSLAGWGIGGGAVADADYYSGSYDERFGEGRLEGFIFATHPLGTGNITAEFIQLGIFSNDYKDHHFNLSISNVTYSVNHRGLVAEVAAEYEDSTIPELRRTRVTAMLGHTLPEPQFGYNITVEGDVAFADFNGGANSNRNDTTAALVLIADKNLGRGWGLEWEAAFVNRFSNRDPSRFTALELGVEINKSF